MFLSSDTTYRSSRFGILTSYYRRKEKKIGNIIPIILFIGLVLVALLAHFQNELYNWLLILPLILIVFYFIKKNFSLFGPSLFFLLVYVTRLLPFVRLGVFLIFPIIVYVIIIFSCSSIKRETHWLKSGYIDRTTLLFSLMVIIISSLALLLWQRIFKPDLQNFLSILPHLSTGWLLLGGTGFAVLNSIVEECIFRGILWDGLEQLFSNMVTILVLQASMFGIIHYRGFPNGLVGVGLAFIYGIFLGMIRHRSRGLLAPIITHIFADATIVSILGSLNF